MCCTLIFIYQSHARHRENQPVTDDLIASFAFFPKAILHDISERKPFLDKLCKVGPSLAKLCKGPDGDATVMAKVDSIAARYNELKSAIETQSVKLQEKDEQTQKVSGHQ